MTERRGGQAECHGLKRRVAWRGLRTDGSDRARKHQGAPNASMATVPSPALSPAARLLWLAVILYALYLLVLARYFAVTVP